MMLMRTCKLVENENLKFDEAVTDVYAKCRHTTTTYCGGGRGSKLVLFYNDAIFIKVSTRTFDSAVFSAIHLFIQFFSFLVSIIFLHQFILADLVGWFK